MAAMLPPPLVKQFKSTDWDHENNWPNPLVGAIIIAVATEYPHTGTGLSPNTFNVLIALCNGLEQFKLEGATPVYKITTEVVKAMVDQITKSKNETIERMKKVIQSTIILQAVDMYNRLLYPGQQFRLTEEGQVVDRNDEVVDKYDDNLANHYWGLVVSAINARNPRAAQPPTERE
ncbi:hypothetical protein MMC14_001186 [Varicellaria rhodocarpa]|nr:hypothetical protein [Varicellaria rhodocarpa]